MLTEEEGKEIMEQLLDAVNYCHQRGLIHRDLKLSNILLVEPNSIKKLKIIDFGISGIFNKGGGDKTSACTLAFSPPELISGKDTESKPSLDIWSLGIILYYILTKRLPFGDNEGEFVLFERIQKDKVKFPKNLLSREAKDLIRKMLDKDPKKRITLE